MSDPNDRAHPGTLCGFCFERTAGSGEHIYDDWVCRRLEAEGITRFTHSHSTGGERKVWTNDRLDRTANVVCKQCNSTWMNELTNAAKPAVEAIGFNDYGVGKGLGPVTLSTRDVAAVVAWALLKAMVMDLTGSNQTLFYTKTQRLNFYHRRSFPRGIRMWLSSMFVQIALHHNYTGTSSDAVKHGLEFHCANYGVGRILIQTVHCRWLLPSDRHNRKPPIEDAVLDQDCCIPLWPHDGSPLSWPPPYHLGNKGIEELINRLYPPGEGRFVFPAALPSHGSPSAAT